MIHQNIADRVIGHQRFQWPQPEDFVVDIVEHALLSFGVQRRALFRQQLPGQVTNFLRELLLIDVSQQREIQRIDESFVQADFGLLVFEFVGIHLGFQVGGLQSQRVSLHG